MDPPEARSGRHSLSPPAPDAPLLRLRRYGDSGPPLFLLHGGPGVSGYLAPVGAALADAFRVYEPFQRGSGGPPLTVARHVEDLRELIEAICPGERPALLGHSWGALLALAFAAAHPDRAAALVLVGCTTLDERARRVLADNRSRKTPVAMRRELASVATAVVDRDRRLRLESDLLLRVDSFDVEAAEMGALGCDARAHEQTWADALRLQATHVHPAAFRDIRSPVLMLHGAEDSLPGPLIHSSLVPYVTRIVYRELAECGHFPWLERSASEQFYGTLRRWLAERAREAPALSALPGGPALRPAATGQDLQLTGERFAIVRLRASDPVPDWIGGNFWSVTRTSDEISVVCTASSVPPGAQSESGWRRIKLRGPLPLTAVGVLASVLDPLKDAEVPVFVLSTHDTDHVLVPEDRLDAARRALVAAGHRLTEVSG